MEKCELKCGILGIFRNVPSDNFRVNASVISYYLEHDSKLDITNAIFQLRDEKSIVLESSYFVTRNSDNKIIDYTFDIQKIEKKQIA